MRNWQRELRSFVRRYYALEVVRGLLWFSVWFMCVWLVVGYGGLALRESVFGKTILFYSSILVLVILAWVYWIPGLVALLGIRGRMNEKQAAQLVKKWLPNLEDRLLNALELLEKADEGGLWKAAFDQRDGELESLNLSAASSWHGLRKKLWLGLIPIALVIILVQAGEWNHLREGTRNVLAYSKIETISDGIVLKWADYQEWEVLEGESLTIEVENVGEAVPTNLYVAINGARYPLMNEKGRWFYKSSPIKRDMSVAIVANDSERLKAEVKVLGAPNILSAEVELAYPDYISKNSEAVPLSQQLFVPRGTEVLIKWNTENVSRVSVDGAAKKVVSSNEDGLYQWKLKADKDGDYEFIVENLQGIEKKWMSWKLRVNFDKHPQITDSWVLKDSILYHEWKALDDYGLSKAIYRIDLKNGESLSVPVIGSSLRMEWNGLRQFDAQAMVDSIKGIKSIQIIVWDNDAISGKKQAYGSVYNWQLLNSEEAMKESMKNFESMTEASKKREAEEERRNKELKESLNESITSESSWRKSNEIKFQLESLKQESESRKKRLNKKKEILEDWKRKSENENLAEIEKRLEEILKKQEKEKLDELLEKLDEEKKEEILKRLEQEREKNEEMKLSERRLEELMKRAEVQLRFDNSQMELEKLVEDQEALLENSKNPEEENLEQKELGQRLEEWNKEFEQMLERNKQLDRPMDIDEMQEERSDSQKEMKEASESAGDKQKTPEQQMQEQKESAQKLQEMLESMQAAGMSMSSQSHSENMETLRQIQDNLLVYSNGEEGLAVNLREMRESDPSLKRAQKNQQKLRSGAVVIRDSLRALAERVPQIKETVFEKLSRMDKAAKHAQEAMGELQLDQASSESQYSMTAANELALMLDETMQQMQMQMASMMSGKQNCNKPGGAKPSASGMAKMQNELMKGMQKGMSGGEGKSGKDGKGEGKGEGDSKDKNGLSPQEFAEMLKKQEALRQMWEKMMNENKGNGGVGEQEVLNLMKESERELASMQLNKVSIERQKEIESRLLEAEKADRERGQEEQRESEQSKRKMDKNRESDSVNGSEEDRIETERVFQKRPEYQRFYQEKIEELQDSKAL